MKGVREAPCRPLASENQQDRDELKGNERNRNARRQQRRSRLRQMRVARRCWPTYRTRRRPPYPAAVAKWRAIATARTSAGTDSKVQSRTPRQVPVSLRRNTHYIASPFSPAMLHMTPRLSGSQAEMRRTKAADAQSPRQPVTGSSRRRANGAKCFFSGRIAHYIRCAGFVQLWR